MAAYIHTEVGTVRHVDEGSWQHDYMEDPDTPWRPATRAEIAQASGIYLPPDDDQPTEPAVEPAKVKPARKRARKAVTRGDGQD